MSVESAKNKHEPNKIVSIYVIKSREVVRRNVKIVLEFNFILSAHDRQNG